MLHIRSILVASLLLCVSIVQADHAPLFPFVISDDAPDNIANASRFLDAPAGKNGLIRVKNGQFHDDKGRVLFWGTNLCFDACFPSHEDAERLADRIARFGFNAVRLHHMDARDIWGGPKAKSLTTIDADQLDKLDYLIFQLKKRGIYVNINLHVSRQLDDRDGFPGKDKRPKYDKGLDNFYPPLIELQKKYAKDLLTHVNPYTKTAYIEEPAVCMVEINNENSIVREWANGTSLETMPDPYAAEYRRLWNDFLRKKYGTTEAMKSAWNCRDVPYGKELLQNENKSFWRLNTGGVAEASININDNVIKIDVRKPGKESWIPQLVSGSVKLENEMTYTVSFRAKADKKQSVSASTRMNHAPWTNLGFQRSIALTDQWQTFSFQFLAGSSEEKARLDFSGFAPGRYEIADLSLKHGGLLGPTKGQTLESGTIPTLAKGVSHFPKKAVDDFCVFLFETERFYWLDMYRYLKDELKVRQPISGTQLNYGSTVTQAMLDYCDVHAYWNHPSFPGKPWDRKNWYVRNRALVNSAATDIFAHLATRRVDGKPYTVSEYNHPFPNQYQAEGLPMLAAFGRFQDWDGIFQFTYGNALASGNDVMRSYFNMQSCSVQLAHNIACSSMFLRGDAIAGKNTVQADWTPTGELSIFQAQKSTSNFNFKGLGIDSRLALLHPTSLTVTERDANRSKTYPTFSETTTRFESETKQLLWDMTESGKGFFAFDGPNTKVFTGFVEEGREHSFDGVGLRFGKTRLGWCTISLVSVDGNGFGKAASKPVRILLAATGLMQNSEMELRHLDGDKMTLDDQWGKAPILCEGISATISLPVDAKNVRCHPLDEKGNRRESLKVRSVEQGSAIDISSKYKTVWYEIHIAPVLFSSQSELQL